MRALKEEDPDCAQAVENSLDDLLQQVSSPALARWVRAGVRLYSEDRELRRGYFAMRDPLALEVLRRESRGEDFASLATSLSWLANGLLGTPLQIQSRAPANLADPPMRPILSARHLLLPDDYTVLDAPDRYSLYCAAVAHAVAHLRFSRPSQPVGRLKPMALAVMSAVEDARVERLLALELPGVLGWFRASLWRSVKRESLAFAGLVSRLNLALLDPSYVDDSHWVNKARGLFEARATDLTDYVAFRGLASILANDLGQLRVPFRVHQYVVPAPYRDDNSYLWTFEDREGEVLTELELESQCSESTALSPDQRGAEGSSEESPTQEIELARREYQEWDHRLTINRARWCTVIEKLPAWRSRTQPHAACAEWEASGSLKLLRARRAIHAQRLRRQPEGDELDLNAVIEAAVEQRSRMPTDSRLFIRAAHEPRVSSTLVLLDLSASTNDRSAPGLPSFLDLEKAAALLLARSTAGSSDRIAIHGFCSNTRAEVSYYKMLDFGASLDGFAANAIAHAPGRHSTRMGAAIRHATACLGPEPSDSRSVLIVTDGAPSDIDVHESKYLVEDARAAVHEARVARLRVHCLAVDRCADTYVRQIFGWGNYQIEGDPSNLPRILRRAYSRLTSG